MPNKKLSDDDIIANLQGDANVKAIAQSQLYERFFHLIKKGSRKYSITEDTAASAYSDAIIAVINNITRGKFERRCSLEDFTSIIFSYKCIDEVRKNRKIPITIGFTDGYNDDNAGEYIEDQAEYYRKVYIGQLPDKTADIVQKLIVKQNWAIIYSMLLMLGEKYRKILLLWANYYSDSEIAEELNYSNSKVVRITRLRCIEKLRLRLLRSIKSHE